MSRTHFIFSVEDVFTLPEGPPKISDQYDKYIKKISRKYFKTFKTNTSKMNYDRISDTNIRALSREIKRGTEAPVSIKKGPFSTKLPKKDLTHQKILKNRPSAVTALMEGLRQRMQLSISAIV